MGTHSASIYTSFDPDTMLAHDPDIAPECKACFAHFHRWHMLPMELISARPTEPIAKANQQTQVVTDKLPCILPGTFFGKQVITLHVS